MNWMDDFIARCLAGIPQGSYRTRAEKELTDHLLALNRSLEEAGHSPEEAQRLTVSQMGAPAELARSYLREWKRRSLRRRLTAAELILFIPCIMAVGALYVFNAQNFGKALVAYWGLAAILVAGILLCGLCGFFVQRWTTMRLCCLALTVMQLPPIWCWIAFSGTYEFTGVMMVPGWLGLLVHVLFLVWSVGNYKLFTRFQQEDNLTRHAQSA